MARRMADEFPRLVEHAESVLRVVGLAGHPDAVEHMAARMLAEIEEDRAVIAGKIYELIELRRVFTATEIEGMAYDIRHAARSPDGEFEWSFLEKDEEDP